MSELSEKARQQQKLALDFPLSRIFPVVSLAPLERTLAWRKIKASRKKVINYRKQK